MNFCMVCVRTKHNNKGKGSICSIIVLTPTLITKPQSPLSNLLQNVTPKLLMLAKPPILRQGENEVAKYDPIVNVTIIYPSQFIKSQCIYIPTPWNIIWTKSIQYIPLKTSSIHPLLNINNPSNSNKSYIFLVWAHFHCYHKDRSNFTIPHTIHYDWTLRIQLTSFEKKVQKGEKWCWIQCLKNTTKIQDKLQDNVQIEWKTNLKQNINKMQEKFETHYKQMHRLETNYKQNVIGLKHITNKMQQTWNILQKKYKTNLKHIANKMQNRLETKHKQNAK